VRTIVFKDRYGHYFCGFSHNPGSKANMMWSPDIKQATQYTDDELDRHKAVRQKLMRNGCASVEVDGGAP
jgi:hypothetical protein